MQTTLNIFIGERGKSWSERRVRGPTVMFSDCCFKYPEDLNVFSEAKELTRRKNLRVGREQRGSRRK